MDIPLSVILTISAGGAFGGIVLGLSRDTSYRIQIPGGEIELGFFGDSLIGIAAAIAVFSVAGPLLNIDFSKLNEPQEFVKAVAIAIIAGFGGISLLHRMSSKLIQQVGEVSDKIESVENFQKSQDLMSQGDFYLGKEHYEESIIYYDKALTVYPKNTSALISKGYSLKRLGRVEQALESANKAASIAQDEYRAWYNRASYKSLLGYPKGEVFSDLRKAITISPVHKKLARDDPDFENLKYDQEFVNITS